MSNDNTSGSTELPVENSDDDAARRLREQDEEHQLVNRQLNALFIVLVIMGLCFYVAALSFQSLWNSLPH